MFVDNLSRMIILPQFWMRYSRRDPKGKGGRLLFGAGRVGLEYFRQGIGELYSS